MRGIARRRGITVTRTSSARKRATRARAAAEGGSYTRAHFTDPAGAGSVAVLERMRLSKVGPELAARMLDDARARAARLAEDDTSREADRIRQAAVEIEHWEQHRAGRPVRLWAVYVDVYAAAVDEDEARRRLTSYQRGLFHYAPGIPAPAWPLYLAEPEPLTDERDVEVLEVPADELAGQQREQLVADYPPHAWQLPPRQPDELYGKHDQAHLDDFLAAMRLAHTRLTSGIDSAMASALLAVRGTLPGDAPLRFFRCQRRTQVLAGPDEASARARGEQLAATVVDHLGRPAGRLAAVEAEDGFASAVDGHWVHPAEDSYGETVDGLWADYDAYQECGDHQAAQAETMRRGAELVRGLWDSHRAELRDYQHKLHIQPDGRRTLSTPAEFAAVEQQVVTDATEKQLTATELTRLADEAEYLADRVYGKAVDTDGDVRLIERTHHRAVVLRRLAAAHP